GGGLLRAVAVPAVPGRRLGFRGLVARCGDRRRPGGFGPPALAARGSPCRIDGFGARPLWRHSLGRRLSPAAERAAIVARQSALGSVLPALPEFHVPEQCLPLLFAGPRSADSGLVPDRIRRRQVPLGRNAVPPHT